MGILASLVPDYPFDLVLKHFRESRIIGVQLDSLGDKCDEFSRPEKLFLSTTHALAY